MDCVFCKIIAKEIPSSIVYEDDDVLAFDDIAPEAPVHVLVVPKKHIASFNDLSEADNDVLLKIMTAIQKIAVLKNIDQSGYRIVNNCGADGGQTVGHLHFHLLGGREMLWPAG